MSLVQRLIVCCLAASSLAALPPPACESPAAASLGARQGARESPGDVLARAKRAHKEDGPKSALPLYERALALYRQAGDRRNEALTLGLMGNCYKSLGELEKALTLLNRSLEMKRALGDRLEEGKTLSNLGLVCWKMARYADAIDLETRAIAIGHELGDRLLEGAALNNLSLVYDEMGDYQRSLPQYRRVLEVYRGSPAEGTDMEADTLGNIGGVHLLLGQYREALRYYEQALSIDERLKEKPKITVDLGNLALCHLGLGQMPQAFSRFDRALALAREAGLMSEEADWLKGKATGLVRTGNYAGAIKAYGQAVGVYERAKLRQELVEALNGQGVLLQRLGDAASAERSFRRAIDLARAINHPRGITVNLIALGDLECLRKRLDHAAARYREALSRATGAGDRANAAAARVALAFVTRDQGQLAEAATAAAQAVEDARALGARPLEAEALFAHAEVSRARQQYEAALGDLAKAAEIVSDLGDPELAWRVAYARGQSQDALGRSEDAILSYQQAVESIEAVRGQLREERFRASYLEDKYQVYVSLVHLLLRLGRTEEAFAYAERLHARAYMESMSRGAPPIADEAHRQAEVTLRERVRQIQRAIEQEQARSPQERQRRRPALELFSSELLDAERAYRDYLDSLSASEPGYAAARRLETVSAGSVSRLLAGDEALAEYVVAEESVSIFVLRSEGAIRARTVPIRSVDLSGSVGLLRDLIKHQRGDEWQKPAARLHQVLVAPVEQAHWLDGVRHLYIVPHGILHYLSFATLAQGTEKGARLLVSDYDIAYLPSATLLGDRPARGTAAGTEAGPTARASRPTARDSVLAMAPGRAGLPHTRREAAAVATLFPKNPLLLVGRQATESAFKAAAGRYQLLHLATHGYFDRFNPVLSGLELEPDTRDDGHLEVHEILGLRLGARLVVLSACDTALGAGYFTEVPSGDDIVGLSRAFLFAGSAAVVASQWAVNDESTLALMTGFYQQLSGGDTAAALASAQREFIRRGGREAHPYFWGAFVLVGQRK